MNNVNLGTQNIQDNEHLLSFLLTILLIISNVQRKKKIKDYPRKSQNVASDPTVHDDVCVQTHLPNLVYTVYRLTLMSGNRPDSDVPFSVQECRDNWLSTA